MKKVLLGLIALVVVLIIGIVIAVVTVDPNKYKGQIITMLEKQTGRTVKLDGPLKLGVSLQGITLSVNNAAIDNPGWASRPQMASIGELDLGIALLPLLDKKVVVTGLKITKADIQLETNKNGQSNTDFQPAGGAAPATKQAKAPASASPVAISVDQVSVKDSRLAMRDKDGSTSVYNLDKLTLDRESAGMGIHFTGSSNGTPVTLDVKTGAANLLTDKNFTFNAEAEYANYKFNGDGKVDLNKKTLALSSYKLDAGHSELKGALSASWGGAKSTAQGNAQGDSIDLADFKPPAAKGASEKTPAASAEPGQPARAFSDAPLNLQGLKSADAHFDIKLASVKSGDTTLKNVTGKVVLVNGTLMVDFPGVQFGGSTMNLKATVDAAAAPARVEVTFAAPNVEFGDLFALAGMKQFITGKANANFSITSAGNSLHDMASRANGSISVISDGGKVSSDALQGIYSGLAQLVTAGSGGSSVGLDCLAARFNIKDGVMADNGILADTTASVVKGSGDINLGAETNNLLISSKPKLAGKYGNLAPSVHITGTLLKPAYGISTTSVVQNAMGLFMKGGTVTSTVPDIGTPPAGQNACVYTLDHPAAVKPAASTASNSANSAKTAKPADQLKNLGNQLMQGLLGGKH